MARNLPAPPQEKLRPIKVVDIELGAPLDLILPGLAHDGAPYERVSALVRLFGRPLGLLEAGLPPAGLPPPRLAELIWSRLGAQIRARLEAEGAPPVRGLGAEGLGHLAPPASPAPAAAQPPFVSVVVATRERPAELARCLDALLALDYPAFEILVVDNAAGVSATEALVRSRSGQGEPLRYLREPRPGVSLARNTGLAAARGAIVAFTDDDVRVDRGWLKGLVAGFAADEVACVTGLVLPAELETPAQLWFEQFGGFAKGYERRSFDLGRNRPPERLFPYTLGAFGAGASMAVRAGAALSVGGFDPALGPGTPAMGGEDLALYFDLLSRGYTLVYEPSAIARHVHRREEAALRRQLYGYGLGLSACLTRCIAARPARLLEVAARADAGLRHALSPASPKNARKAAGYPPALSAAELLGMLAGPLAYLHSRLASGARRRAAPPAAERPGRPPARGHA